MEISFLNTVLAVVEHKTFSAAAASIPCAQSSVSRQIAKVESDLGMPIFEHVRGGKVELTAYGQVILPQIRQIVESYNRMQQTSVQITDSDIKKLSLAVYYGPFNSKLKGDLIAHLFIKNPNYSVSIHDCSRSELQFSVKSGNADFGIMYDSFRVGTDADIVVPSGLNTIRLFKKYPCIAMAPDHPLAERDSVSFSNLKYETFVLSSRKKTVHDDFFFESCHNAGFIPDLKPMHFESYSDTRDAAVSTNGCMYPTFSTRKMSNLDCVKPVPVENPSYYCVYYLVYKDMDGALARSLAKQITDYLTEDDNTCEVLL